MGGGAAFTKAAVLPIDPHPQPCPAATRRRKRLFTKPMRDHLAHHVRQCLIPQCRDRHPAHAVRQRGERAGTRRRYTPQAPSGKCVENMRDDAGLAMPARGALQHPAPALSAALSSCARRASPNPAPRSCRRAALFPAGCGPEVSSPRVTMKRGPAAQRSGFLQCFARKHLLIAAQREPRQSSVERTQRAGRLLRRADRELQKSISAWALSPARDFTSPARDFASPGTRDASSVDASCWMSVFWPPGNGFFEPR